MCLGLDCGCCDDGVSVFPPHPYLHPLYHLSTYSISPILIHVSFRGENSHFPLLEAKCERTTAESSLAPPSAEKGNDLSFIQRQNGVFTSISLYSFIFGCAGSSLLHRLFSSCSEWGLLFVEVCGLLIVVASLVADHGLQSRSSRVVAHGLISSVTCGIFLVRDQI